MTRSHGEIAAGRIMAQYNLIVIAALDGNRESLQLLMEVAAVTAYTEGYGAAASVVGVTL